MATTQVTISPEELKASQHSERSPDPCIVVIFGASGDLTKRKLLPALYHLEQAGNIPEDFAVVGVARRPLEQLPHPLHPRHPQEDGRSRNRRLERHAQDRGDRHRNVP